MVVALNWAALGGDVGVVDGPRHVTCLNTYLAGAMWRSTSTHMAHHVPDVHVPDVVGTTSQSMAPVPGWFSGGLGMGGRDMKRVFISKCQKHNKTNFWSRDLKP